MKRVHDDLPKIDHLRKNDHDLTTDGDPATSSAFPHRLLYPYCKHTKRILPRLQFGTVSVTLPLVKDCSCVKLSGSLQKVKVCTAFDICITSVLEIANHSGRINIPTLL